MRGFWLLVMVLLAGPAAAECVGRNLFAQMPEAEQAALRARAAAEPYGQGLIWRAQRDGHEVIIAGTYHLSDPRHAPLRATLAQVMQGAAGLLVEAGPAEEARLAREMGTRADLTFDLDGPALPDLLGAPDWAALSSELAKRGLPETTARQLQPWYAAILVSMSPCMMQEMARGAIGLDKQLIAEAEARGLPIAALEPYDRIFTLFQDLPDAEARLLLRGALTGAETADDISATLADLYFAQETGLIGAVSDQIALEQAGPDHQGQGAGALSAAQITEHLALTNTALVDQRNRAWVPVIEAQAARAAGAKVAGPLVMAAGALHLPGDSGVLALLAARGWQISPYRP